MPWRPACSHGSPTLCQAPRLGEAASLAASSGAQPGHHAHFPQVSPGAFVWDDVYSAICECRNSTLGPRLGWYQSKALGRGWSRTQSGNSDRGQQRLPGQVGPADTWPHRPWAGEGASGVQAQLQPVPVAWTGGLSSLPCEGLTSEGGPGPPQQGSSRGMCPVPPCAEQYTPASKAPVPCTAPAVEL